MGYYVYLLVRMIMIELINIERVIRMVKVKLSNLMGEHKIKTFTEIETVTKITRKTLAKLYNGESKGIDFSTIDALCDFFNCSLSDLLEYVPDRPKGSVSTE